MLYISCGLMQEHDNIQLYRKNYNQLKGCGLMQEHDNIQREGF